MVNRAGALWLRHRKQKQRVRRTAQYYEPARREQKNVGWLYPSDISKSRTQ